MDLGTGHTATVLAGHGNAIGGGVPDANATWVSSAPAVATVTPGPSATATITGVAAGNAIITATDPATGCTAAIPVTVVVAPPTVCDSFYVAQTN